MPVQRPGTVTAAAVMAIIYGCLFTICGLFGVVMLAAEGAIAPGLMAGGDPQQVKLQKEMQEIINAKVPAYEAVRIVDAVINLSAGILMLIGGVALLKMAAWSRPLVLTCCFVKIAVFVTL